MHRLHSVDIAAAKTYFRSLSQEESLECCGKSGNRKKTRRFRERILRVCNILYLSIVNFLGHFRSCMNVKQPTEIWLTKKKIEISGTKFLYMTSCQVRRVAKMI